MKNTLSYFIAGALASSGCGAVNTRAGFPDVQSLVDVRTGQNVHWNDGSAADAESATAVRKLLSEELTPSAAIQVALLNNRRLQASYERLGIAQADLVQAGLLKNPIFNADIRFGRGTSAELSVVEDFLSILQMPLRKRIASAVLEETQFQVAQEVFSLAIEVKKALYKLQAAEQMCELRKTISSAAEVSADVALRQRRAGNTTELDLANEQALFTQAQLDLSQAEAERIEFREALNSLLGVWGSGTEWKTSARLPEIPNEEPPMEGLESRAMTFRLDLQAAKKSIEGAAQALGLSSAYRLLPNGGLGLSADREADGGEWLFGPALEFPIPLITQGQPMIAAATAQLRQRQEEYRALAIEIRSQVRAAQARTHSARIQAKYYETVMLPLRRRILDQTQLNYNAMLMGVFQLLQAKKDEIETGKDYVRVLENYWLARTDLEQAIGTNLSPSSPPDAPQTQEKACTAQHDGV